MAAIGKLDDMERKGLPATQILSVNKDVESLKAKKQRLERDCGVAEKKLKKYEFSEELCDLADYYNIGPEEIRVFGKTIEKISRARSIEYWQAALILLDAVQRYKENEGLVPEYRRNDIAIQVQRAQLQNMRLLREADELARTTFIAAASRGIDQKEVRRFAHIVADYDLNIKKINNKLERAGRQKMLQKKLRATRIATAAATARQKPASAETVPGAENQEQEIQQRPSDTSPQPAPPTSASQPKSQEGVAAQNTHSSSDARSSAADAEPANHGNEGYDEEEESQEGGQTEAEGDKDTSLEPQHPA
jgi:hypothetical protein